MTIKTSLSAPPSDGWISPNALTAEVLLRNLFGTAAARRRIKASFRLAPSAVYFPKYPDYRFVDPYNTTKSYDEDLGETDSDSNGRAKFNLQMDRFAKGVYLLRFVAEGFEQGGARSLTGEAVASASPPPLLIPYKPDAPLTNFHKPLPPPLNI